LYIRLNYYNRTLTPKFVTPTNDYQGNSCKVYYNGVEQLYSDDLEYNYY